MLTDERLRSGDPAVYAAVTSFARAAGSTEATSREVGLRCRLGASAVAKALARLEAAGWLTREVAPGGARVVRVAPAGGRWARVEHAVGRLVGATSTWRVYASAKLLAHGRGEAAITDAALAAGAGCSRRAASLAVAALEAAGLVRRVGRNPMGRGRGAIRFLTPPPDQTAHGIEGPPPTGLRIPPDEVAHPPGRGCASPPDEIAQGIAPPRKRDGVEGAHTSSLGGGKTGEGSSESTEGQGSTSLKAPEGRGQTTGRGADPTPHSAAPPPRPPADAESVEELARRIWQNVWRGAARAVAEAEWAKFSASYLRDARDVRSGVLDGRLLKAAALEASRVETGRGPRWASLRAAVRSGTYRPGASASAPQRPEAMGDPAAYLPAHVLTPERHAELTRRRREAEERGRAAYEASLTPAERADRDRALRRIEALLAAARAGAGAAPAPEPEPEPAATPPADPGPAAEAAQIDDETWRHYLSPLLVGRPNPRVRAECLAWLEAVASRAVDPADRSKASRFRARFASQAPVAATA